MNEVVFVGTSDAFGAGGRRQSAILVRGPRGTLLMDCGATTNTGLAELGVDRNEIETILISHFHGDHFGGIPLFLLAALYEDYLDMEAAYEAWSRRHPDDGGGGRPGRRRRAEPAVCPHRSGCSQRRGHGREGGHQPQRCTDKPIPGSAQFREQEALPYF